MTVSHAMLFHSLIKVALCQCSMLWCHQ